MHILIISHLLIILTLFNYSAEGGEGRLGIYMAVAAAVRQIRPMRRHTGRSATFESAINTDFHGTSRSVLHRSVRIKDGRGIDICCDSGSFLVTAMSNMFQNANPAEIGSIRKNGTGNRR